MPDHQKFLNTKYFNSLNGIRCLSIIFVIGYHFASNCRVLGMQFSLAPIFKDGYLGVNLFFVISGFLITTLLLREQRSNQGISVPSFYRRRISRIFPLYYTVLIITILIQPYTNSSPAQKADFINNLPFFMTYTSNWFVLNDTGIFVFAWTLATEEQFYFVWPHILKLFSRLRAIFAAILMIVINQIAIFNWIGPLPFLSETQNLYFVRILASISTPICLGVLLAFAFDSKKIYKKLSFLKHPAASTVLFTVLLFCLYFPKELNQQWVFVINCSMMAFVGSCVYQEKHSLSKILNSKIFFQVGLVSYGMYLFNIYAIHAVDQAFLSLHWKNTDFQFLVSLLITFMLAHLSFYHFESRFRPVKIQNPV